MKPAIAVSLGSNYEHEFRVRILGSVAIFLALGSGLLWLVWRVNAPYTPGVIVNNLRAIDARKQLWAAAHGQQNGAIPTKDDLAPYFLTGKFPPSIIGETYHINPIGQQPTATTRPRFNRATEVTEPGFLVTIPER